MFYKYIKEAKQLKDRISSLEKDLSIISHTFSVKKYDENSKSFIDCIDEDAYDNKNTELSKNELLLGILKFKIYFMTKKRVQEIMSSYIACLNKKIDWLKTERTIKTKSGKWILDYRKIHEMERYIKSESDYFQRIIDGKAGWIVSVGCYMKKNRKVIIGILLFFILSPICAGIIVSIPSFDWLITKDNDWIGFWGNYIGGIIGAIIGGVVAYKVAEYGFKSQRELDRQVKTTELMINNLPRFIAVVLGVQQKLLLSREYIFHTYKTLKEEYKAQDEKKRVEFESIYEDITRSQSVIEKNRIEIYDYLEKYQVENEISRFLVNKYQNSIVSTYDQMLKLLRETDKFETLFTMCNKKVLSDNVQIDFNGFDKELHQLDNSFKGVDYSLYLIITLLRNEISSELGLTTLAAEEKEDYINQRFTS